MLARWHGLAVVLAATGAIAFTISARAGSSGEQAGAQTAKAESRVAIDGYGRKVTIPAQVNRIVTLAPNLTETVYALGLGDKLVGDTNECDKPAAAKLKPHVGDYVDPDLEAIVALRPDLVLATSANRIETVNALTRLGIPVYATNPQTVLGMLESVRQIADVTGARQEGAQLAAQLRQRLDAIHARLADRPVKHVLFVIWDDPLISIGQNTFIEDALRWAGAESVVLSHQKWPQLSMEEVVRLQPEYIVFAAHEEGSREALDDLRARPVWRDLDAVEMGHVVDVSEEALRPSPELVDVIEKLAHEMHPDAFRDKTGN
ncbi:MAG: ABC transporter substrate-binding protein [Candidatus Acidiferrales bacterium]